MLDLFSTLKSTPLPVILTLGGIIFLFLGIVGNIKQLTTEPLPAPARKWAAGTGAVLLTAGILLYVIPVGPAGETLLNLTPTVSTVAPQQTADLTTTAPAGTSVPETQEAGATPTVNAQGYEVTTDDTGAAVVLIPGGTFLMGTEGGLGDEIPVRPVVINKPYWLDVYEVSNGQYKACVEQGKCVLPNALSSRTHENYFGNPDFAGYPVTNVNWDMAATFCQKFRSARLPTEAEWEFAARGTDQRTFPWGDKSPDCNLSNAGTGPDNVCIGDTQPVSNYEQGVSPFGLYNMSGNVWEWVSDWYGPYSGLPSENPAGNPGGTLHILRGGGWSSEPKNASTTVRYHLHSTDFDATFGIRCARSQ